MGYLWYCSVAFVFFLYPREKTAGVKAIKKSKKTTEVKVNYSQQKSTTVNQSKSQSQNSESQS